MIRYYIGYDFQLMCISAAVTGTMIGSPSGSMHDVQNRIMSPVHSQGRQRDLFGLCSLSIIDCLPW